jgi:Holliday junction resolvase RusA-like endonuclease
MGKALSGSEANLRPGSFSGSFPTVEFTVFGSPHPKGSKTAFPIRRKDGRVGVAVREGRPGSSFEEWRRRVESVVQDLASRGAFFVGPVTVRVEYYFEKPKSAPRSREWPEVKPDVEKLDRAIFDCLEGALIRNDAQIVEHYCRKRYAEQPRAEVWLSPAGAP